jgi:hypothetical protein
MTQPLVIDLPHKLGKEEARRRIAGGIGKLQDHVPGGAAVDSSWQGDRMHLVVRAMGQEVTSTIDVGETIVRLEVLLPALLAMLGNVIGGVLKEKGTELLEDKR